MYAKVQHCRGENHGGGGAVKKQFLVVHRAVGGQQFCLLGGGFPGIGFLIKRLFRCEMLFGRDGRTAGGANEVNVLLRFALITQLGKTPEITSLADRPI